MGRSAEIIEAYNVKYPWIMAIHRLNGGTGKARALNEALDYATGEVTVFFDADYLPNKDIIQRFTPYFQDLLCGAAARRRVLNGYVLTLCERCVAVVADILEVALDGLKLRDLCLRVGLSRTEIQPYLDYLERNRLLEKIGMRAM